MATKHTHPMVFGRLEAGCPRCAELAAGAPPIRWRIRPRWTAADSRELHDSYCWRCPLSGCVCGSRKPVYTD